MRVLRYSLLVLYFTTTLIYLQNTFARVRVMIRKILVFIGVASFSAGLSACGVGEAKVSDEMVAETAQALPVETSLPFRDSIYATYQTTSTLESDADAPIIARVPGDVVEILVEEGDTVRSGQVLARLDGDRMRFELQQARANLEKVTREYERLLSLHERGLVSEAMFDGLLRIAPYTGA